MLRNEPPPSKGCSKNAGGGEGMGLVLPTSGKYSATANRPWPVFR